MAYFEVIFLAYFVESLFLEHSSTQKSCISKSDKEIW